MRTAPGRGGKLPSNIEQLIRSHGFSRDGVAVVVVDDSGQTRVALRANKAFKPASNQKVLTTAAALHWLSPDYVFTTTVSATAPLLNGTIAGDVVVRGGGDPNISGRFYGDDPTALLKVWAERLYSAGLRKIEGDLIADDRLFDAVRFPPTWRRAQEASWYSAQISALSLNDNCLDVTVTPGRAPGSPARIQARPLAPVVRFQGKVATTRGGRTSIILNRKTGTNDISITGKIVRKRDVWKSHVTFDDPALVFVSAFARALSAVGVEVVGSPRRIVRPSLSAAEPTADIAPRPAAGPGPVDPGAPGSSASNMAYALGRRGPTEVLVRHVSKLVDDLPVIHKRSQNLHAELVLRVLGAEVGGEGSLAGGARAIRRFLAASGLPQSPLTIADGSGLSHDNRVSARLLARSLDSIRRADYFTLYRDSLPIAGVDGTLRKRFRHSDVRVLKEKVFAKTGFIRGVSALSGYVVRGERVWAFSVLINGFPPKARSPKRLQELICKRIYDAM